MTLPAKGDGHESFNTDNKKDKQIVKAREMGYLF
jgi:hypothetical protein